MINQISLSEGENEEPGLWLKRWKAGSNTPSSTWYTGYCLLLRENLVVDRVGYVKKRGFGDEGDLNYIMIGPSL